MIQIYMSLILIIMSFVKFPPAPLILPKWWQRLLLPNLNFSLHIYHHMNQNIAWCELPKVHALFVKAGQVNPQAVFDGFGDYWRRVVAATN